MNKTLPGSLMASKRLSYQYLSFLNLYTENTYYYVSN